MTGIIVTPLLRAQASASVALAKSIAACRARPIQHGCVTALRDEEGVPCTKLHPIYGDGEHDDAPGLNALLVDRCSVVAHDGETVLMRSNFQCPALPADRIYRIESPIFAYGALNFSPAGAKWETVWFPHYGKPILDCSLSVSFDPGEVRFFWFDFADGDPETDTTLRVTRVLKD